MITLDQAVETFMLSNKAEGLAQSTLTWYESILSQLRGEFAGRDLDAISADDMRVYFAALRDAKARYQNAPHRAELSGGLSSETLRGRHKGFKRFWSWCALEYGISSPMRNIRSPQPKKQTPKAAALDDLRRLIRVASVRDRAILLMLADTGIRAGGLVGLRLDDLDLARRLAIVTEKGGKSRSVAFLPITAEAISAWLAIRPAGDTVFCGRYGSPLAVNSLWQAFGRLKQRAGVDGRTNPHSFRHFFAREYIQNGGDLATLTHLMGHSSSLITTAYYAVFLTEELKAKHDRHSPIRNLEQTDDNLQ